MIKPLRHTENILEYNNRQLKELCIKIQEYGCAVFYDQNLTEKNYIDLIKRIGDMEAPDLFMNPKNYPEIFLVTDRRDPKGNKIGMFGDSELGWHSNGNSRHNNNKILIGLYCIQGDVNTTLSICHTSMPFYDLPEDEKEYWRSIKIKIKFQNDTMYHLDDNDPELEFMSANRGSIRKLIGTHPYTGKEYFYFPYHFIVGAWEGAKKIDHIEMKQRLIPIIFKSKYQYHHVFKEGDLLLMDQFSSLHRRSPVMGDRLLWRVAADYERIMNE